ncbi:MULTISPECIES: M23 family metallopeptidase [Priestia]|uniref:Stage II sporulation protein Q n=2 Tax=Priestia TaxID=2800373 RepID=D5DWF5_PRIM1|nr:MULTISPECIES: M23 family metallopeptidase [Priestia]KOP77042.1 peptidase M23 [Bacillus sp. FJAT-21351]KQU18159.1 peptidase M23 [Bacillus sp. Leaf75]ADE72120.1 stage II sporulation protein Q [Priestia megaterium QM B1551]KAA8753731.1 M23 family metallopeptidase [Priestia megaterium]MBA9041352.1 stage II sporulation protein Q [Priestia aryabhattai]
MREEEKKRTSPKSKVQKLVRKRWVFPAIYLASAAIILTAVLWFQANGNDISKEDKSGYSQDGTAYRDDAVEVNASLENLKMPVASEASAIVKKPFYDDQASEKQQEEALVFYNNTYHPNTGVDLAVKGDKSFDVVAAASGTVTKATKDPLLGYVVEIDHKDGLVTQYQSLEKADVEVGDIVKQGQTIAKAGKSLYNQEAKTHVHFEVRKDGVAINPSSYFGKSVSSIKEVKAAEVTEPKDGSSSEESKDSEKSSDEKTKEDKDSKQPSTDTSKPNA